jgi:hypothetical protein
MEISRRCGLIVRRSIRLSLLGSGPALELRRGAVGRPRARAMTVSSSCRRSPRTARGSSVSATGGSCTQHRALAIDAEGFRTRVDIDALATDAASTRTNS